MIQRPVAALFALLLVGCEDTTPRAVVNAPEGTTPVEQERDEVQRLIADLAKGRDPTDAKAAKIYDEAVGRLISRGSALEPTLIDALRRSDNWAIRLGIVEVLQATGSKACIEHLIAILDDEEPLVAHRANATLEELCQHQEIPRGTDQGALPPVPRPTDLALDAEQRAWTAWHREHRLQLRTAWEGWWDANRDRVVIP